MLPRRLARGWPFERSNAKRRAIGIGAALVLTGAGGCTSCGPGSAAARPDVLLVTVDTLRADHLGSYGYARATSPHIDEIAAQGALFEIAYAPMGATSPSHATLFTSRHPIAHGLDRNGLSLVDEEVTLAELLRSNGYRTAAFVSAYPVSRRFGFAQGFDVFDDDFEGARASLPVKRWGGREVSTPFDRPGRDTVRAALAWIERQPRDAPRFVWVHLFDPHFPYGEPSDYRSLFAAPGQSAIERMIAHYDGDVRYADTQVGRLVEGFERMAEGRETLIVITGDHGEGLFDHDWRDLNRFLYEEEVRVPLIVRWWGRIRPGTRVRQPAHLVDVVPTLVSALGLDALGVEFDGIDLMPAAEGETEPERPLLLQRPYYPNGRPRLEEAGYGFGVRSGRWKLIEARDDPRRELYDLEADPRERHNLARERPEVADALSARIDAWRAEQAATRGRRELEMPSDVVDPLRELGYLE